MADLTDEAREQIAMSIYWAAYELYPHSRDQNHPGGFDKEMAWDRTSDEHRRLCRLQAVRAHCEIEQLGLKLFTN